MNSSIQSWIELNNFSSCSSPSGSTNMDNLNICFVLKDFLQTTKGLKILDMCGGNDKSVLTNEARDILITNIVQFFIENNVCMKPKDFEKIKSDIVFTFPKENGDYYYKGGKRPTGKLYNKYRNSACNLRKIGYFKSAKKLKIDEDTKILESESEGEDLSILEADKNWLKVCYEPWETVEIKWINTYPLRKNDIRNTDKNAVEFLTDWPLLKSTNSFRLIEIDFEHKFKDKSLNLINGWKIFKDKAPKILERQLKQAKAQKELRNLSTQEDICNYRNVFLYILRNECIASY